MHLSIQLGGLLLYALVLTASSQERDRLWHSTTPGPTSPTSGVLPTGAAPVAAGPEEDIKPVVPEKVVASAESDEQSSISTSQHDGTHDLEKPKDVLTAGDKMPEIFKKEEPPSVAEEKKEKKDRKWISAPQEAVINEEKPPKEEVKEEKKGRTWISAPQEAVINEEKSPKEEVKEEKKDRTWISAPQEKIIPEEKLSKEEVKEDRKDRTWISSPKEEFVKEEGKIPEEKAVEAVKINETGSIEESQNISAEISVEEVDLKGKKKKPRKWISVPGMETEATAPTVEDFALQKESLNLAQQEVGEQRASSAESSSDEQIDEYSINAMDMELPVNISELLLAAEEGIPMIQETIISKKTTVYVTISDTVEAEPLYVNLTGIRHYTGQERRMTGGCLDLSDLMLTGEETKEVLQRMAKHKFHKLDLSSNNITEFPANTFSPVAFTVRELRLDGNPLASNDQGEASVLQRGGLFHLTELRELNLSSCGLQDMDYFTPWNSNHLEIVDLSNNKLTTVPSNLQFFHKIKKLFLDGNPITLVSELPFALLWNMQVLSLAGCQVATISDDPFRNMDKLKEISLEGNNLTQISHVRLPRSNSAVKMFLSGNPWHCACEMLNFIEHYHYAIRDIEYIRCASPRWLEGLRTAYLTKEILSLDSVDGDCHSASPRVSAHMPVPTYSPPLRADRLQLLALIVFVLAALFMLCHVLWARKKDKYRFEEDRDDIHYIRIEKKPNFK